MAECPLKPPHAGKKWVECPLKPLHSRCHVDVDPSGRRRPIEDRWAECPLKPPRTMCHVEVAQAMGHGCRGRPETGSHRGCRNGRYGHPPRPPVWTPDPLPNAVPLWAGDARKMPQAEAKPRRPPTIRKVMLPEGLLPPRLRCGLDGE